MIGKVLYLDDHEGSRLRYKSILTNVSVECITVGFIDEARKKLEDDKSIRLLIADYMLVSEPVSEFTNQIRKKMPQIPIIVLTGQEGTAWEKVKDDKMLIYDVLLHKNVQITNSAIVDIVTSFLETQDFRIFEKFRYIWSLDEKREEVALTVVSKRYPSLIVSINKKGKIEFKGSHFVYEENLAEALNELDKMVLWLLKKVDLSQIENLPPNMVAEQIKENENPDRILAAVMGSKRSTIQRKIQKIDEQIIQEKSR